MVLLGPFESVIRNCKITFNRSGKEKLIPLDIKHIGF